MIPVMRHTLAWILGAWAGCVVAVAAWAAPPPVVVQANVEPPTARPGQSASVSVTVDVPEGYHAQSATPSDPNAIAFVVKLQKSAAVVIARPVYPPGHEVELSGLGKLSIYTGRVVTQVPIDIPAGTPPGPVQLKGSVRYQLCDDATCYMPATTPFELTIDVGPTAATTATSRPASPVETPAGARQGPMPASTRATTQQASPLAGPSAPTGVSRLDLFGLSFMLGPAAWVGAMAAALVVGLLFNFMPCVLPVVPLKIMGFYEAAKHSRMRSLGLSLAFGAGIVAVFALLAGIVLATHSLAGHAGSVQWGSQFENRWFKAAIALVLVVMAAGMFGAFTVMLPQAVYRITPRQDSVTGNVLLGVLAAILSTPCTAPMFPGLLAWSTSQPVALGTLTMVMVGVGMALPYALLGAWPELGRRFPHTGAWSELIKHLLGFLLLATAGFFGGPLLVGTPGFWWIIFAAMAAGAVFLVIRTIQLTRRAAPIATSGVLAMAVILAGLWLAKPAWPGRAHLIAWQPYTVASLDEARGAGHVAIVEFTATWCGNCQVLDRLVFQNPTVAQAIQRQGVVPLRADLTQANEPAEELLGRLNTGGGIPLTAVYPPVGEPIILTSVYTSGALTKAVDQAAATGRADAAVQDPRSKN